MNPTSMPTLSASGVKPCALWEKQSSFTANESAMTVTVNSSQGERPMLRLFILATILMTGEAVASEAPPVPEGGLSFLDEAPCVDSGTGEKGYCYLAKDIEGNLYITFWQEGTLMLIRRRVDDDYETIWVNDIYMGV